jgi:hypothetical protein
MFDALLARDFEQPAHYWTFHRLLVDIYSVQHDAYIRSAKSLAAHLCGLCIAVEHDGDERRLRSLQNWLSTNPPIRKPELPQSRGQLTICHVAGSTDPAGYGRAIREWASSAWDAYASLQPLARDWLALARALPPTTP